MAYRNGNYTAFYVNEPFSSSNLSAFATKDFVYYNMLRSWKGNDSKFPFIDSHEKNYNVRDESDWEKTLKPRITDRINQSKNLILFLSSITKNSKALRHEIDYAINNKGLPVIVIYPEYKNESDIINCKSLTLKKQIVDLWDQLPIFRNSMNIVPTLHLPLKKLLIESALKNHDFMISTKCDPVISFYNC